MYATETENWDPLKTIITTSIPLKFIIYIFLGSISTILVCSIFEELCFEGI